MTINVGAEELQQYLREHPQSSVNDALRALATARDAKAPAPFARRKRGHVGEPHAQLVPDDNANEKQVEREILEMLAQRSIFQPSQWSNAGDAPEKVGSGFVYKTDQHRGGGAAMRGNRRFHATSVSKGLPDLIVVVRTLTAWRTLLLEVKRREGGTVSPEQKVAAKVGALFVVRSAAQVRVLLDTLDK